MEADLRAGIAIFNAGRYHAAHDAWEERWLELEMGSDDERFLHGLIQYTAAVHHASTRNWAGATGLAESGGEYLAELPSDYRDVNVGDVRDYLAALQRDPELIERRSPVALTHAGVALAPDHLEFETAAVAARVYAEIGDVDENVVERGIEYARADIEEGRETSPFVTLVMDLVRDGEHRVLVFRRLGEHVERRARKGDDVAGLFE